MQPRSRIHMLTVAAARIEQSGGNPVLVKDLRQAAEWAATLRSEGRDWKEHSAAEEKRIERQRTLFAMLPSCDASDRLKAAMMQRAYDLLWDGNSDGCDALLEFIPSTDAEKLIDAWCADQEGANPPSKWYGGQQ